MTEDELIERWNALTDAREEFLAELEQMERSLLVVQPAEGGWSALQVVEHILASETGTLGYMQKKTSSGWEALDVAGPEHQAAGEALVSRLRSDERYAAPSVLPVPAGTENADVLLVRWEQLRDEMEGFIFSLDEEFFPKLIFRQPAAGPLHLFHTLEFLAAHIRHHIPQIQRIRVSLGV